MESPDVDLRLKLEMVEMLQDLLLDEKNEAEAQLQEVRDDVLRRAMNSMGMNPREDLVSP